jgi:hypothetical protein
VHSRAKDSGLTLGERGQLPSERKKVAGRGIPLWLESRYQVREFYMPYVPGASTAQLYGIAILTGVGFTMSLFIGTLAFEDETLMAQVRIGVLVASVLSGLVAWLVLDQSHFCLPCCFSASLASQPLPVAGPHSSSSARLLHIQAVSHSI